MKKCFTCQIEKPTEQFYGSPNTSDGLGSYCKDCTRAYSKKMGSKREKKAPGYPAGIYLTRRNTWMARFMVGGKVFTRVFKTPEEAVAWRESVRADVSDGVCQTCGASGPGQALFCTNCAKIRKKERRKITDRVTRTRARALYNGIACDLDADFMDQLLSATECSCCGGGFGDAGIEIDRVVPSEGYVKTNCLPLCGPCNRRKSDHTPESAEQLVRYLRAAGANVAQWSSVCGVV